jgi:hypothetical protein
MGTTNGRGRDGWQWKWWWWWERGQQVHHPFIYLPCHPHLLPQSLTTRSKKHPPHAHEWLLVWWIMGAHHQCCPHPTPHRCGQHSACPHTYKQLLVGWDHRCSLSMMTGQGGNNTRCGSVKYSPWTRPANTMVMTYNILLFWSYISQISMKSLKSWTKC